MKKYLFGTIIFYCLLVSASCSSNNEMDLLELQNIESSYCIDDSLMFNIKNSYSQELEYMVSLEKLKIVKNGSQKIEDWMYIIVTVKTGDVVSKYLDKNRIYKAPLILRSIKSSEIKKFELLFSGDEKKPNNKVIGVYRLRVFCRTVGNEFKMAKTYYSKNFLVKLCE